MLDANLEESTKTKYMIAGRNRGNPGDVSDVIAIDVFEVVFEVVGEFE